jgi:hypothetical protein
VHSVGKEVGDREDVFNGCFHSIAYILTKQDSRFLKVGGLTGSAAEVVERGSDCISILLCGLTTKN